MDFIMRLLRSGPVLSILLLTPKVSALQITPNSPCASVCMKDPSQDTTDPDTSSTSPSDIVCNDADYESTATGQRFESCMNCLRNSTASSDAENDQSWLLYNLRYGLDTCIFAFPNSTTGSTSTPCTTSTACGPLQDALASGILDPDNDSTYGYCSADNYAVRGSFLLPCIQCLHDNTAQTYLANFLTILQAGCSQEPPAGTNIGFRGDIFSTSLVNITYPGDKGPDSNSKKGLSQGAIIGIAIGGVLFLIAAVSVCYICYRKTNRARNMKRLKSPLRSTFGSKLIPSPSSGGFGNSYRTPPTQAHHLDPSTLSAKELKALGLAAPTEFSKEYPVATMLTAQGHWQDAHAHLEATESQRGSFPVAAMPTHQAYIPSHQMVSPTTSIATSNLTYQMTPYSSAKNSPNYPPADAAAPVSPPIPASPPASLPGLPAQPAPPSYRSAIKVIPPPLQVPRPPRINTTPQIIQPAQFPLPTHHEDSSQVTRPGLHSQTSSTNPTAIRVAEQQELTRNNSIAGSWRRARSASRTRGTSRNDLRDTLASMEVPVLISGPMVQHGGRFDYGLGNQQMEQTDATAFREGAKHPDDSPQSAGSQEQWPGTY